MGLPINFSSLAYHTHTHTHRHTPTYLTPNRPHKTHAHTPPTDAALSRNLTTTHLAALAAAVPSTAVGPSSSGSAHPTTSPEPTSATAARPCVQPSQSVFRALSFGPEAPHTAPGDDLEYTVHELALPEIRAELNKMTLGFPCSVTHVIDRSSPLFGLSVEEMDAKRVEVFVIVEGVDPGTSNAVRSVKTYQSADLLMNRVFSGLLMETRSGRLGLRLNDFDTTAVSEAASAKGKCCQDASLFAWSFLAVSIAFDLLAHDVN